MQQIALIALLQHGVSAVHASDVYHHEGHEEREDVTGYPFFVNFELFVVISILVCSCVHTGLRAGTKAVLS